MARNIFARSQRGLARRLPALLTVLFAAAILVGVTLGARDVSNTTREEQLAAAQRAVRRAAVQCYAIEGQYPSDLEYLQTQYGLILNRDKYVYHYNSIGSNLMPEISVFPAE